MRQNEKVSANATKYSTGGTQSIKSKIQKISAFIGFMMILLSAGLVECEKPQMYFWYLVVTATLLYVGKAFSFQQK